MTIARSFVPALLAALALLAGAGSARADQLEWIPRADAARAAAQLTPGSLVVQWISHMSDSRPVIYRIEKAEAKDIAGQDGLAEVSVRAVQVGQAHTVRQPAGAAYAFDVTPDGAAKTFSLDLAYTYVASAEMPGVFVNLGKRLSLECAIKAPAIEVGAPTIAALRGTDRGITGRIGS